MTDETTLDELETRLAGAAAALLKTSLQLARMRAFNDDDVATIDGLTACSLTITAEGPAIQLDMLAPTQAGTLRLFRSTFKEQGSLQTLQ